MISPSVKRFWERRLSMWKSTFQTSRSDTSTSFSWEAFISLLRMLTSSVFRIPHGETSNQGRQQEQKGTELLCSGWRATGIKSRAAACCVLLKCSNKVFNGWYLTSEFGLDSAVPGLRKCGTRSTDQYSINPGRIGLSPPQGSCIYLHMATSMLSSTSADVRRLSGPSFDFWRTKDMNCTGLWMNAPKTCVIGTHLLSLLCPMCLTWHRTWDKKNDVV